MELLLLQNGIVVDGDNTPGRLADVLIDGDRIVEVGRSLKAPAAYVLDCSGHIVCPGFVDAHSHSDLQALQGRREKLNQGVTTDVVGNCGFSAYPAFHREMLHEFANGIFCGEDDWGWDSAKSYLDAAASDQASVHIASQVGHGSLRISLVGNTQRNLEEAEMARLEHNLDECLSQGACGFSTGLMYAPGSSAPFIELQRLCSVVARHGKTYSSHIRSYFSGLVDAVEEQLALARATGCRLQISHLQTVGRKNWDLQTAALDKIESAREEGIDVAFDCYPYVAGSSVLTQVLPQWTLEGGTQALLARLRDAGERSKISRETVASIEWDWSDIVISAVRTAANQQLVGLSLRQIAERRACECVDALIDLLLEEQGAVNMICFNQSEDNLRQNLAHPLSMIISDSFYVKGRAHPRLYGTFPFLLGTICRERKWMKMEEAIHKITRRPAERFGLKDRGRICKGYMADITVFDPETIGSAATYENPDAAPTGILQVLRSGRPRLGGNTRTSPSLPT